MKRNLHIVKIGGNIIDNPEKLSGFLKDFSKIKEPKILVHGGGKIATDIAEKMGIKQKMIDGRRVTDSDTLRIISMVYAGLINKNIVAELSANGNSALGLSGVDADSILATRRPTNPIDFGFVGDVHKVNGESINKILDIGFVPVFCAITHDGKGQLLNTNADTIANAISTEMSENYNCFLYYCFEKKGVLENIEDDNSVISKITPNDYETLKQEGKIFQGMIPKIDNAFSAIKKGVKAVYIMRAEELYSSFLTKKYNGTKISEY